MSLEDRFIYYPAKFPDGEWDVHRLSPCRASPAPQIEDCHFTTKDGIKLHGWFCTAQKAQDGLPVSSSPDMVLLWFHGNAGNITHRYDMVLKLLDIPVKIFIIDYRGYGKSQGRPSEEGLYLDARAAWDFLIHEKGFSERQIILFGKSLGGAPAVDLAARVQPAGLIVQSSFTSVPDMAASFFPLLPRFLIRTRMDSAQKISGITCPKLIVHSPSDEIVPFKFGCRLFKAAPEPKEFCVVEGAPHNQTCAVGGKAYLSKLRGFVQTCATGPG